MHLSGGIWGYAGADDISVNLVHYLVTIRIVGEEPERWTVVNKEDRSRLVAPAHPDNPRLMHCGLHLRLASRQHVLVGYYSLGKQLPLYSEEKSLVRSLSSPYLR